MVFLRVVVVVAGCAITDNTLYKLIFIYSKATCLNNVNITSI